MALKHCRAVQQHATIEAPLGRFILVTIAMDIGHDDSDSYTSYRTIAERVGCHYNSVGPWVKKLEEAGDLTVTKKGNRHYYNIPFVTIDEPLSQSLSQSNGELSQSLSQPDCDNKNETVTTLSQPAPPLSQPDYDNLANIVTVLSQQIEELSQQVRILSQSKDGFVTPQTVTEVRSIKGSKREDIYIHPDPQPIVELKTAISTVTKTAMTVYTEKLYDEAAYYLFGMDATPQDVTGFGDWWHRNGYYQGKPALKSLIDEWKNYADGVEVKQRQNGNGGGVDPTKARLLARLQAAQAAPA